MARKKVLLLVTLSEMGGAQKVVYHLAAGLDREKLDITVACAPGGELVDWLKKLPYIKVVELSLLKRQISPLNDLRCLSRLVSLIKTGGYHIVHCHSSKAGILGRLAARMAGVRQIYFTVHGWGIDVSQPFPVRIAYTLAERIAGALSTRVVCVSRCDLEKGLALGLAGPEKLAVIYNGVPDIWQHTQIMREKSDLRMELGLGPEDFLIGTVMRLAPPKKPLMFLESAARLLERHGERNTAGEKSFFFAIIGDGPQRVECERFIAENNLGEKVFLMGTREDAARLVAGLNVYTLLSDHEGLPLTVIEAMLAGVPVVASNVGGLGEMVKHGETGYLVDSSDADSAVSFIDELVMFPAARGRMGSAGRERAIRMFNLEKMIKGYFDLYCELI